MKRLNNNRVSKVRLTESKLRNIVSESVKNALKHIINEEYNINQLIDNSNLSEDEKDWLQMIANNYPELFNTAINSDSYREFLYSLNDNQDNHLTNSDLRHFYDLVKDNMIY
jgi:hypothetical protein